MSPILGIWASAQTAAASGDFESIATISGTGSSGTLAFTSIPQTYKHLQLRFSTRSTSTNTSEGMFFYINNTYASPFTQYSYHSLAGNGSSVIVGAAASAARIQSDQTANASMASNVYDAHIIDILDYTSTNKNPVIRWMYGWDNNGSGSITLESGAFNIAGAVTQFNVSTYFGNFTTDSKFSLYGIKG